MSTKAQTEPAFLSPINGTVVIDGFTVSRAGKSTKITGPREPSQAEFKRLKAKADAMLGAGSKAGGHPMLGACVHSRAMQKFPPD